MAKMIDVRNVNKPGHGPIWMSANYDQGSSNGEVGVVN